MITGIIGQDGSYLAESLLKKGYELYGVKRRVLFCNIDKFEGTIKKLTDVTKLHKLG